MNFQRTSTVIGRSYENLVQSKNPHFQGKKKFTEVGLDADFHYIENEILYVIECKAYNQKRTDCIKKAIANAFCIKQEAPDCKFILYLGATPTPKTAGDKMLKAALQAGVLDRVEILPYEK